MVHIVVLDYCACVVRKYMLDAPFENSSEAVEQFLLDQGLVLSQCEWMTSDTEILEVNNSLPIKTKKTIVIGIKQGDVIVEPLEFSETDDDYVNDDFESFDEYVKHYTNDKMDEFCQQLYMAIAMDEKEAYELLQKLGKATS